MGFNKQVPEEVAGPSDEPMYLCASVLPMGFRNSVSLAQHIHRHIFSQSLKNTPGTPLLSGESEHRRDRPFTRANPAFRIYLDNYDELEKVDRRMAAIIQGKPSVSTLQLQSTYRSLGVPRHPKKAVARQTMAEVQGAQVDGVQGTACPKTDKIAKYFGLTLLVLQEGRATQRQMQVVAGGLVYMSMFRRPLLGCLNHVWSFIQSFEVGWEHHPCPLPREVQQELYRFLCLIPLAKMDFRTEVESCVTASDASTTGGGLCMTTGLSPWGALVSNSSTRGDLVEPMDMIGVLTIGLFDGIAALRVAADALGLPVHGHVSVECHGPAQRVVESQFPGSILVQNVEEVDHEMVLTWACRFSGVGLVILGAGPPCQGVSGLNADRKGALKDRRSCLHVHVKRVYELVVVAFPWAQVHYLMESVASMDKPDREAMSESIGATPYKIDSAGITLCRRPRLYWLSWLMTRTSCNLDGSAQRALLCLHSRLRGRGLFQVADQRV